ncbi:MAG: PIN domain-containing protein [Bacteroidales bacterium]|nr:PIN domain-containing protein [Bacteroidales bacterium]
MGFEVIDITKYSPNKSDLYLFDTSVWMYLFCPLGGYDREKQVIFSSFLRKIKNVQSSIFITSLILSEFANAYLRMDHKLWEQAERLYHTNYKRDFVGTYRYKRTVITITSTINTILSICIKEPDDFNVLEINKILNHFQSIDFNDSYYLELSSKGNLKIVSADYDFIKYKDHSQQIVIIPKRRY